MDLLTKVTIACGHSIYNKDVSTVSTFGLYNLLKQ